MDELETRGERSSIDANFAANLRHYRELAGISQDELASGMAERGFPFSQATIWKIEQGKRPVRIGEAVALAAAVRVPTWRSLIEEPRSFELQVRVDHANHRANDAYEHLKSAARDYLRAQIDLAMAAYDATEAGLEVNKFRRSWLEIPAERAVIETRIEFDGEDEAHQRVDQQVDAVITSLRESGYEPVLRTEDIQ